jgi:hypothetical protein
MPTTTSTVYNTKTVLFNLYAGTKSRSAIIGAQTQTVAYAGSNPAAGAVVTATANDYLIKARLLPNYTLQRAQFTVGGDTYVGATSGVVVRSVSPATGAGTAAGTVVATTGEISIQSWPANAPSLPSYFAAAQVPPGEGPTAPFMSAQVLFRTAAAPLRPGSVSVQGTMEDGTTFNVTCGVDGKINGTRVKGRVNHDAGLVELYFVNPANSTPVATVDLSELQIAGVGTLPVDLVRTPTIRYNAVSYTYLPLDSSILGLDPIRLPQDGRVPVFKAGRVVVVHNTQTLAAQTVSNGQTVDCGRIRLARVRVFGSNGAQITTGYTANMLAGTVTFSAVAGYSQPVTIEHRVEDEALCVEAQITGDLRLSRPLTHAYPAPGSYVSSALIFGTLQARAGEGFGQAAWTSEWADAPIGATILASYNQAAYPIAVTNAGAITERWALIFTSATSFRVVGEEVGQIITGDINSTLSPVNPATGVPYFTITTGGWGSGWVSGNVFRFNTVGAMPPAWVVRTTLQGPAVEPGTDQMSLSIRGSIDA